MERGLEELYAFFERNEAMITDVVRDGAVDPVTREMGELRFGPGLEAIREVLSESLPRPRARDAIAALDLALDFNTGVHSSEGVA